MNAFGYQLEEYDNEKMADILERVQRNKNRRIGRRFPGENLKQSHEVTGINAPRFRLYCIRAIRGVVKCLNFSASPR